MAQVNADLWPTRSWNQRLGRLAWYLPRLAADPHNPMWKLGYRLALAYCVEAGEAVKALDLIKCAGLPIPLALAVEVQKIRRKAAQKPAGRELAFAVDNLPIGCIRTGARRRAA